MFKALANIFNQNSAAAQEQAAQEHAAQEQAAQEQAAQEQAAQEHAACEVRVLKATWDASEILTKATVQMGLPKLNENDAQPSHRGDVGENDDTDNNIVTPSMAEKISSAIEQCKDTSTILKEINLYLMSEKVNAICQNDSKNQILASQIKHLKQLQQDFPTSLNDERNQIAQLHFEQIRNRRKEAIAVLPSFFKSKPFEFTQKKNCVSKLFANKKAAHWKQQYQNLHLLFKKMEWDRLDVAGKKTAPTVMEYMKTFDIPKDTITQLRQYACDKITNEKDFNIVFSQIMETPNCTVANLKDFRAQRPVALTEETAAATAATAALH